MTIHERPGASAAAPGRAAPAAPYSIGAAVAFGLCVALLTASLLVGAAKGPALVCAVLNALAAVALGTGVIAGLSAARSAPTPGAQAHPGEPSSDALLALSCDWYWEMDQTLRFTRLTRANPETLTLNDEEILGKRRWELEGELIQPQSWSEHQRALEAREPFRDLILRRWHPNGRPVYHVSSGRPVFDADGAFLGYRGVGRDITEQFRTQEWIERLATLDGLTRLNNRQAFDEQAQRLLASAYAQGQTCAMLYIDLDDFRLLNKGYGHRIGDQMLAVVSERMRSVVRGPNLLGRRGGDELVALLVDVPGREMAGEIARTLIETISQPARVFGMEVTVTASIGIALFPHDGMDLDSLLNAADAAMYQGKEGGRRTHAFFTPAVERRLEVRLRLERQLRREFDARDFRLFYQPMISLADGRLVGAEALMRWNDVELGDISPTEFIPIAEQSGLIVRVGDWVLREVCRQWQLWRQIGVQVPPVAINMSGVQLRQNGCVEGVLDVLHQFGMTAADIEIEVTETGLLDLDNSAVSLENLNRLDAAGIKIALDDFGIGYSSLSYLRDLPIRRLKIDRTFTFKCMNHAPTLTIVKAVVDIARSMPSPISVTAEGIETHVQQTWMQHLGCESAQGYLYARPMSAEDFLRFMTDRSVLGREKSLMR